MTNNGNDTTLEEFDVDWQETEARMERLDNKEEPNEELSTNNEDECQQN